ncbi:MAG: amidase [Lautropia sp.]
MTASPQGVVAAADAFARGEASAEAMARAALERLRTTGVALNAVVALDEEAALSRARDIDLARRTGRPLGPLAGVPMAHKDLFYRKDRLSECGAALRRGFRASQTASVLSRLDEAGAIDLGRLHMAEFALSPTGFNEHYGHALNPWSVAHVPGGSSSGGGVAVAADCIPGTLGTDTGGSIRHPAAMCGITGIKPTWSRVSSAGVMPLSWTLDCVGPLARSARDCARLLAVIAGADEADARCSARPVPDYEAALDGDLRGVRIASVGGYYAATLEPAIAAHLAHAQRVLTDRGATIVRTEVGDMDLLNAMAQVVMSVEAATLHRRWLIESPQHYAAQVRSRIEPGLHYPATRYAEALCLRETLCEGWLREAVGDCDAALIPAVARRVPTIEETTRGDAASIAARIAEVTHCTRAINYLGLPAISVPCGFEGGLPVAFQLVGRAFDEGALLRIADAFQRDTDFHRRAPPTAAARDPA